MKGNFNLIGNMPFYIFTDEKQNTFVSIASISETFGVPVKTLQKELWDTEERIGIKMIERINGIDELENKSISLHCISKKSFYGFLTLYDIMKVKEEIKADLINFQVKCFSILAQSITPDDIQNNLITKN